MTKSNLRFLSAKFTPMPSKGGWAVPHVDWIYYVEGIAHIRRRLNVSLVEGVDYVIEFVSADTDDADDYEFEEILKRIKFNSDESFIIGKLAL